MSSKKEAWKRQFDTMMKKYGMQQHWPHFQPFMALLDSMPRKKYMLEIGPYRGGSTRMFQIIFDRVITIDPYKYEDWEADIKHFSLSPQASSELEEMLAGDELDAIFIDGDHSYRGAREDAVVFSRYLRDQGIIGFHDIGNQGINPWTLQKDGSDALLAEIKYDLPAHPEYSYYGDPFVDIKFEVYDFEGLAALRWKKEYQKMFDESVYIYPLDMLVHKDWIGEEDFQKVKRMNRELSNHCDKVYGKILEMTNRLDCKK